LAREPPLKSAGGEWGGRGVTPPVYVCPADHSGQVSLEVVYKTHILRNAIIWKFMIKKFFYDTQNL